MVEQLKDIDARWNTLRQIRESASFAKDKNPAPAEIVNAPDAEIYVIDVSFKALQDKSERNYLNQLPTSFHLPDEAVDRLRAAARILILNSPDLQKALRDQGTVTTPHPSTKLDSDCMLRPPSSAFSAFLSRNGTFERVDQLGDRPKDRAILGRERGVIVLKPFD
jgi:hypothetical protein